MPGRGPAERLPPTATLTPWLTFALTSVVACSVIYDGNVEQCATDGDCAAHHAVCNRQTQLCVAPPPNVASSMGTAPDAAEDVAEEDASGDVGPTQAPWPCDNRNKPLVQIKGDLAASERLICDNDYLLIGSVTVQAGAVLTIDPGTRIMGDVASKGTLFVLPGGRLVADGLRMAPIVFSSSAQPAQRRPGDWGGVVLLGRASTNAVNLAVEGVAQSGAFGGGQDDDNSGVLRFVRIEYSGAPFGTANERHGLTLGGVGRGTVVSHVQVRQTSADCFRFLGGTANARFLVCQRASGGFVFSGGYRGTLQFLVLQQDPASTGEGSGLRAENDPRGTTTAPITEPFIYNATFCGKNLFANHEQYGLLIQRAARAHVYDSLVAGFEAGFDVRDVPTSIDLRSSIVSSPILAYPEDGSNDGNQRNDDGGLDEVKLFWEPGRLNDTHMPSIGDCFDAARIDMAPSPSIKTNSLRPPSDGFLDTQAAYIGAFRDRSDDWTRGSWVVWSDR